MISFFPLKQSARNYEVMFKLCNVELHLGSQTAEDFLNVKKYIEWIHLHSATSYFKLALKFIEKYEPGQVRIYSNVNGLDEVEISPAIVNKQGKIAKEAVEGGKIKFAHHAFKSLKTTDSKYLKYLCIPEWSLLMALKELKGTNLALENVVKINAWPITGIDLNFTIDQKISIITKSWPNVKDISIWSSKIDIRENWTNSLNSIKSLQFFSYCFLQHKHNSEILLKNWIIYGFDSKTLFALKSEKAIILSSIENIIFGGEKYIALLWPKSLHLKEIVSDIPEDQNKNMIEFTKTLNPKRCIAKGCLIIQSNDITRWSSSTQQNIDLVISLQAQNNFELYRESIINKLSLNIC